MKNILIIKHGSLGDIISSTAAIKPIRDYYNNSNITILTSKKFYYFFDKSNLSNYIIADNRRGLINFFKIINTILAKKFDLIIDLQNSNRTLVYSFFIRFFSSSKINGTNFFSHFRFKYDKTNPPHVIKGLGKQIELIGINILNKPYLEWLHDPKFIMQELADKKYFIVNPGCSYKNRIKRWSSRNFALICSYLVNKNIIPVVIGTEEDEATINEIKNIENNILNLCNKSPVEVIYNLAFKALGALSNDTGPAHLIAATNCKIHLVLSSFSNTNTVIPKSENVTFSKSEHIDDISTEKIIIQIEKIINK
tara:strand:+ start:7910 stop:8836 length:927 start_codon:yes stop_codon:yes gene_type:complete